MTPARGTDVLVFIKELGLTQCTLMINLKREKMYTKQPLLLYYLIKVFIFAFVTNKDII